jgi:L-threonylcarbamoyladenylate synthase
MPIFPADETHIESAGRRLRDGELVAFPTETVYGLGANALDNDAVAKIYVCKGRPSFNPLIVHVADIETARNLSSHWNERAEILATAFWPGPLTLVVPKSSAIPAIVSAGLETVALRVPANQIAQRLLQKAGIPLAAPSANASGEVSPTRASHVIESLGADIWILEGGECEVGIESTVVDVSGPNTAILRPGSIDAREIEALIGPLSTASSENHEAEDTPRASPGMLLRHYAPRAKIHLFPNLTDAHFHAVLLGADLKIGVLAFAPTRLEAALEIIAPLDATVYARNLYAQLREFDRLGIDLVLAEEVPQSSEWNGVRDRLARASHKGQQECRQ